MIVADTNLLAYLVMPGERTEAAEAILAKDPDWVVPILWQSEMRSVVHKYVKRGDLTLARAVAVLDQAAEIIGGREAAVESREVLALATRSGCSTYDCEYVALAKALHIPLVTTDGAVLRAFRDCAVAPEQFLGR